MEIVGWRSCYFCGISGLIFLFDSRDAVGQHSGVTFNPVKWIAWLVNEHGSSAILRERLAQAKEQIVVLESKIITLEHERDDCRSRLQKAEQQVERLKKENDALHRTLENRPNVAGGGPMT